MCVLGVIDMLESQRTDEYTKESHCIEDFSELLHLKQIIRARYYSEQIVALCFFYGCENEFPVHSRCDMRFLVSWVLRMCVLVCVCARDVDVNKVSSAYIYTHIHARAHTIYTHICGKIVLSIHTHTNSTWEQSVQKIHKEYSVCICYITA